MKKLIILSALLISTFSHAGLMIEPGIGYNISGTLSDTDVPARDEDAVGAGYYLRLGFQQLGLFGAFEYSASSLTISDNTDSTALDEDWDGKNLGLIIGYELPVLLRFWGGYVFSSELERNTSGKSVKTYSGNGFKFGIGYKIIPLVSLNLEYKAFTYDEEESGGTTTPLTGIKEISHNSVFASVSIPFSL